MADVARAANVSTYTVSQTLRGRTGVAPATRERVLQTAHRLGYQVHAAASLLAQQRSRTAETLNFAWLYPAGSDHETERRHEIWAREGVSSITATFDENTDGQQLSQQLWHQGVCGVSLMNVSATLPKSLMHSFDWSRFSVVKTSRGQPELPFHIIRHSAFDYIYHALWQIVDRGYRKIAVWLLETAASWDNDARIGGLYAFRHRHLPSGTSLQWREEPAESLPLQMEAGLVWIEQQKPEAILFLVAGQAVDFIQATSWKPGDLGLAAILTNEMVGDGTRIMSGCDSRRVEQWQLAGAMLKTLVGRGETGFPSMPAEQVLDPVWLEGDTLPRL